MTVSDWIEFLWEYITDLMAEGVYGGVLISEDFRKHFPEVEDANVSGITASCFSVRSPANAFALALCADLN